MEKTGEVIDKSSVHRLGIWHSAIHLIIVNKDSTKVIFQKRAKNKDLYPNMWDISVGGHIKSNEIDIDAAKRELEEELGIKSNNIKFIKKYKEELNNNGVDSKEVVSLFVLSLDNEEEKLKLQKEEVSDAKWITKKEMEILIKNKLVVPHIEPYNVLEDILK